jgi:hypothetical protein
MKRKINLSDGIIFHDDMQDILTVFPELKNSFKKNKHAIYYDYDFIGIEVDLTLEKIEKLNQFDFSVKICKDTIIIDI